MGPLILASTSPWRQKMLRQAGVGCTVVAPDVDERAVPWDEPVSLVRELARQKAADVAARHPGAIVIGADQVAYDPEQPSEVWGKPANPTEHLAGLCALRGRMHCLVTGFAIVGGGPEQADLDVVEHETTRLWVRPDLTDDELRAYVATGEGSACAGGYAAEGLGGFLFSRIEGDWFNVLGLPLFRVLDGLRRRGWRFGGSS